MASRSRPLAAGGAPGRGRLAACLLACLLVAWPLGLVSADKFSVSYTRDDSSTLVFGEPKFVRAVGMFAPDQEQSSYVQLRLTATELTEQLRLADPYEQTTGNFSEKGVDPAERRLIDDVDFPTSDYSTSGFIQAIVLQAQDLDLLGLPDADSPLTSIETYCCTPFYVEQGLCPEADLGAIIIDRKVSDFDIWVYDIPLLPRKQRNGASSGSGRFIERQSLTSRSASEDARATYKVRHTGEHVLILSHCDPTLNTEVSVTGLTEWRNPLGYLPGRLFGFLSFHKWMLLFYVAFGLVWLALNFRHWRELTMLQLYTSIVIFLCMAEQLTWYLEYDQFNREGTRSLAVIFFAITLSALRQAVSRMLIVAVSLGYQVVRPTLGEHKVRLIVLGGLYFVLECALELVVRYQQTHALNDWYRLSLTLPVSLLNAAFYWWIFISLYQLMHHLEERQHELKFALYRHFTNTLLVSVTAALAFALVQAYFMWTNQYAWHWSSLWVLDGGFSFAVFTVILVAIAVLFRPSNMASRYAYAPAGGLTDEEERDAIEFARRDDDKNSATDEDESLLAR